LPVERGYQEEINQPAYQKQSKGEKIQGAGELFSIVETMGAQKTEDPEKVADKEGMGWGFWLVHGIKG